MQVFLGQMQHVSLASPCCNMMLYKVKPSSWQKGYTDRSCAAFKYVDKTIDTMLVRSERDMTAEQS